MSQAVGAGGTGYWRTLRFGGSQRGGLTPSLSQAKWLFVWRLGWKRSSARHVYRWLTNSVSRLWRATFLPLLATVEERQTYPVCPLLPVLNYWHFSSPDHLPDQAASGVPHASLEISGFIQTRALCPCNVDLELSHLDATQKQKHAGDGFADTYSESTIWLLANWFIPEPFFFSFSPDSESCHSHDCKKIEQMHGGHTGE